MTNILEMAYKSPMMSPSDIKYSGFAANAYPHIKHIAPNRDENGCFSFFCFVPSFKRRTAFLVRMSMGVKDDTRMKSPRKMMIVKTIALVGGYKYKPGTCVILAVTNKRTVKRRLQVECQKYRKSTN